jgi:hypothetical protein
MALREFNDASGVNWQVWDTHPTVVRELDGASALSRFMNSRPALAGLQPSTVRPSFKAGWLTFACGEWRRRLAPVPAEWDRLDESGLRTLLGQSEEATLPRGKS